MSNWHGFTDEQVRALFNQHQWQQTTRRALVEVADDVRATAEDRLQALQTLNSAITFGLLPPDAEMPARSIRLMVSLAAGVKRRWWWRWRARQAAEQLLAAKWLLQTASQFMRTPEVTMKSLLGGAKPEVLPS